MSWVKVISLKPRIEDPLSYNDLTDKPTIPVNSDFTLSGLSEKSYPNLTDKPTIPDISGKQDTLVSGTTIKTVNSTSLLGSGDVVISGGLSQAQVRRLNA